ncbi:MAG: N-6 DNA methylase [Gemmatimonadales bacterium]
MDFGTLLSSIRTLPDLRRLVAALGHAPAWRPFDPATPGWPVRSGAEIGGPENCPWLALETDNPARIARQVSRSLSATGRHAGLLVLDPDRRVLVLAVGDGTPVLLPLSLDYPDRHDLERLRRLALTAGATGLGYALRSAEALSGEDAGQRFFRVFRQTMSQMAAGLGGTLRPAERETLALVQLTRILFLYFVQSKGWLNGQPDFLRRAVDRTLGAGRRLHRDLFRPLFFGTLNRPAAQRGRAAAFGRIPFLNGGLFEPHALERAGTGDIPDACWQSAFDDLFERFHFTVHEAGAPGAIAPDMLGRVFEGLMAPGARCASGAFYTPALLVTRVVDAALAGWIAERLRLEPAEADRRLRERTPEVRLALCDITILDPAVGSGAFLLGALERLATLRHGECPPAALRRTILERNLFGVDLNPMAVRLAELRLWLAVIAEETMTDPAAVPPLPNLDAMLRQGDSLLDPTACLATLDLRPDVANAELSDLRREFVREAGPGKRAVLRRLRQAETRALERGLAQAHERQVQAATRCLLDARSPTLFGERRGLDRELRLQLGAARRGMVDVRRLQRRLRQEGGVPWFSYECQFADILALGGFDLVIGNPPWVRAEALAPRVRAALAHRYTIWRTSGAGFRHQPDLSLAFLERSVELLAPAGILALLLPAKLATAGYAVRGRHFLARRTTLHAVVDLRDDPTAVFEATTYPAAVIAARGAAPPGHRLRLALDPASEATRPQALLGAGPWLLGNPATSAASALARADHPLLGTRGAPQLGVKTGANAVFLSPPPEIEGTVIRPALRGRDIRAFQARPGTRLLYPHDARGQVLPRLPAAASRYLAAHAPLLRARSDYQAGPLWTLFRTGPSVARFRVVWADLALRLEALALTGPGDAHVIPLNSCYVLGLPEARQALALTAWLNSSWLRALARLEADPAAGGYARFNARVVAALPLPQEALYDPTLVGLAERGARGDLIQEPLDDHTAALLGLSAASRAALAAVAGVGTATRGRSTRPG